VTFELFDSREKMNATRSIYYFLE